MKTSPWAKLINLRMPYTRASGLTQNIPTPHGTLSLNAAIMSHTQPTSITTPPAIISAIATGGYHTCGLTSAGAEYCWGSNLNGQLGNGSASGPDYCPTYPNTGGCSVTPIAVAVGFSFRVLATGWNDTCGITTAGTTYCWGANLFGNLGNGSTTNSSTPVAVARSLSFSVLATGTNYTCGITTAGVAYCWGANDFGQLGNGSTTNSSIPVAVTGLP